MRLRHLRDEISVAWELDRAADRRVLGRFDPDLGCRPRGPCDAEDESFRMQDVGLLEAHSLLVEDP